MIQRIQSLYLLIAAAAYVCLFFFPFAGFVVGEKNYSLSVLGVTENGMVYQGAAPLLAGVILLIILAITIIFLYKKRMVQSRMTAICLLLNVGLIAGMFFFSDSVAGTLGAKADFETGTYIVIVPLVFLVLANRSIRKDEIKVKAADRLR
jgi:glucan phosphoethanolaminetransferase (alkaline phosphatase superfamily)